MQSIYFNQTFKPVSDSKTPDYNRAHVEYIATRPGVVVNKGYGFGLWGQVEGQAEPQDQTDLDATLNMVREISKDHTVYRVILSVDEDTARQTGLHERAVWEKVVNEQIGVIAKEMHIAPKNFCYLAAMHYKKGHPHVHIVYWDKSDTPRNPYLSPERFENMSNHVRAAFNRVLFEKEIKETQMEQKEEMNHVRLQLQALLKDANPREALSFEKIADRTELADGLLQLIRHAPIKGSLKWQYLPLNYKAEINEWLDQVLQQKQFAVLKEKYMALTQEISQLYGNDSKNMDEVLKKAEQKLRTQLGNETMKVVRDAVQNWDIRPEMENFPLEEATRTLIRNEPAYKALVDKMPNRRMPIAQLLKNEDVTKQLQEVVRLVCSDIRIRRILEKEPIAGSDEKRDERADKNVKKEVQRDAYREGYQRVRNTILQQAVTDKGWDQQAGMSLLMTSLLRLFGGGSQQAQQLSARASLLRRHHDLSKEARKDARVRALQAGLDDENSR